MEFWVNYREGPFLRRESWLSPLWGWYSARGLQGQPPEREGSRARETDRNSITASPAVTTWVTRRRPDYKEETPGNRSPGLTAAPPTRQLAGDGFGLDLQQAGPTPIDEHKSSHHLTPPSKSHRGFSCSETHVRVRHPAPQGPSLSTVHTPQTEPKRTP